MKSLLISKCSSLFDESKSDTVLWSEIYKLINLNVSLVDRLDYVKTPYNFKLYEPFKMPTDLSNFNLTYEQCCEKRAWEMVEISRKINKPITVFWSGGIDSTLVLVSFLKILSDKELKDRIIVSMSPHSIYENPEFYSNFVRKKFNINSSINFNKMLDKSSIILGGEHNDQLFGSDLVAQFLSFNNFDTLTKPYSRELITNFLVNKGMSFESSNVWFDIIDNHIKTVAPCDVKTNFDFFWWLNFCFKWQCVYFRILARISPVHRHLVNQEFVDNYFFHFFSTDYFQKWSMTTDPANKINNEWKTYKQEAKNVIYRFDGNLYYLQNKTKKGSLSYLFRQIDVPDAVTDSYEYIDKINPAEFYNPNNSFRR